MTAATDYWYKTQRHATSRLQPGDRILMPSERIVREYIEAIPTGERRTVTLLRADLARDYDAAITCPITTGIHLLALAESAHAHQETAVPVWRVLDPRATVVRKLSYDPSWLWERQESER